MQTNKKKKGQLNRKIMQAMWKVLHKNKCLNTQYNYKHAFSLTSIQEMIIRTRYLYFPIKIADMGNTENPKCYQGSGATIPFLLLVIGEISTFILQSALPLSPKTEHMHTT